MNAININMISTTITFEDTFSFAKTTRTTELSEPAFNNAKANDIGKVISYFDKAAQIRYNMKIISIEQTPNNNK